MKRTWIGIVVAVVGVALIAGGITVAWLFFGALSPEEAVAAVVEKVEGLESYAFRMDGSIEAGGETIDLEFEGVAEENGDAADARISMDGSMNLLGQSIGMSEIILDGKLYLKYDPDPLGRDGQWYYMAMDLSGLQVAQGGGNPSEYLQYMKAYSAIEKLDAVTIGGVKCDHYHLVIDPALIADIAVSNYETLAEQMPAEVAAQFDSEQLRAMYEGATMTMELYVGTDDDMPYRQVITMDLVEPQPMSMTITMDLFDFGEPVDISAPADAVPLPVELGGNAGA